MKEAMEVELEHQNKSNGAQGEKEENSGPDEVTEGKEVTKAVEDPAEGNNIKKIDDTQEENTTKDGSDVYAYTRREEFTSENFKIELRGLPRYYHVGVRIESDCLSNYLLNVEDHIYVHNQF